MNIAWFFHLPVCLELLSPSPSISWQFSVWQPLRLLIGALSGVALVTLFGNVLWSSAIRFGWMNICIYSINPKITAISNKISHFINLIFSLQSYDYLIEIKSEHMALQCLTASQRCDFPLKRNPSACSLIHMYMPTNPM